MRPSLASPAFAIALACGAISHAAAQASGPLAKAPDGRALALTFNDEFTRDGNDAGPRWATTYGDGRKPGIDQRTIASNDEEQLYIDRAYAAQLRLKPFDPVRVRAGVLTIQAARVTPDEAAKLSGRKYASGLVSTLPTLSQRYGYFEARAKIPRGKGLWPAIWMLPDDHTWPPEIDVMESIGNPREVYFTAHSKAVPSNSIKVAVSEGFHTYGVSWDPRNLIWYVDGKEVGRQPTPADMHKPMYLIANLAVGGKWPGTPDAATAFPAEMSLDYVRIYKFATPSGQ